MSKYYDSVHLQSDQKDLLISQLKAEIFELQHKNKDYNAMRDQLLSLEYRFKDLQDEKARTENDYRNRCDYNLKNIGDLKREADDLRSLIHEKSRQNNDLQAELAQQKDLLSRRDNEIMTHKADIASKADLGFQLRRDHEGLQAEIAAMREERDRDLGEAARLRDLHDMRSREANEHLTRSQALEAELARNQDKAAELSRQHDAKDYELRKHREALLGHQAELDRLKETNLRL